MIAQEKLAMARMIGGVGRALPGIGRAAVPLAGAGALGYSAFRAAKALKSFNPENPAAVGQNIAEFPQRMADHNSNTQQVIDWAGQAGRRKQ